HSVHFDKRALDVLRKHALAAHDAHNLVFLFVQVLREVEGVAACAALDVHCPSACNNSRRMSINTTRMRSSSSSVGSCPVVLRSRASWCQSDPHLPSSPKARPINNGSTRAINGGGSASLPGRLASM